MPKNGTGPTRAPARKLVKKLAYTEAVRLNNATSEYAYLSKVMRPEPTKAVGAAAQFAAYELFRIKRMKVSIQNAFNPSTNYPTGTTPINTATAATVWTAADWGMNETISGETIMQYQNAKKNTISLNGWTQIVDTAVRVNGDGGVPGALTCQVIYPPDTWFNTSGFPTGNFWDKSFSGYQLFIQLFGSQNLAAIETPSFTIVTELHVEFMQPAIQNNPSTFASQAFGMKMVTLPDPNSDETRAYVFNRILVEDDDQGVRTMVIRLNREDGVAGSLTFTAAELREAIQNGNSGQYFGGRRIIYDGPYPPRELPQHSFELLNED